MATPMTRVVTIKDVLNGLEALEQWARQLREALASIDQGQQLDLKPRLVVATAPNISGGLCPPPKDPKKPKKKKSKR